MIFSTRLESSSSTEKSWLPVATSPIPGDVADDLRTRLESFSNMEKPLLPEATSPIPGGVADDLLDEAGVLQQHGKCLAA
jgi:hypothetical protein